MGLYLNGGKQLKVMHRGRSYRLLSPAKSSVNGFVRLLSADGYTLLDANGLYLVAQTPADGVSKLLSVDTRYLLDADGLYLTVEENK